MGITMLHVPKITLYDKIQISKQYISEIDLKSKFSYRLDEEFVSSIEEDNDFWYIGSGCLDRITADEIVDNRINVKLPEKIQFKATLHAAQQRTLDKFLVRGNYVSGILKAKCGWGKSFWGVKLVAESQQPTIILMHNKSLAEQWRQLFLEFTNYEPGMIGDGVFEPKDITIGLYISVNNKIDLLKDRFSRVIVDEMHRCAADLFSTTLNKFPARYKNGMSATPTRRDGKHILFPDYFVPYSVEAEEYRNLVKPDISITSVPIRFPVLNPTRDWSKALSKVFSDRKYLDKIAEDVNNLILDGRNCLVIAPRVEALNYLEEKILFSKTLIGSTKNRDEIISAVGSIYKCLLTTTIFDEGLSCHILDTLVLTGPIGKNFGLLEQRIGRIQREHPDKQPALLKVYWLQNHILTKQQGIELTWYHHQGYKILN